MTKVVMTGAGSGGHITPLLAVAAGLKKLDETVDISYIGQRGDSLGDIPAGDPNIDHSYVVRAGKLRRYHDEGFKQLLDVKTMALNVRDAGYVLVGIVQSYKLLRNVRPDVIFIKGGFVGVPVGLAAAALHIPFITHDSDAVPGLANRIIARWAYRHAVALPAEVYAYPIDRTITTGIPLQPQFEVVTPALTTKYRNEIHVPADAQVLSVVGGGLGAQTINNALIDIMPHLLAQHPKLYVIHGTGRAHEASVTKAYEALSPAVRKRVTVLGYANDIYRYSGAADIVLTRAGATNLAEFALQGKACIVVPHPNLTGGHQVKNAQYMADNGAIELLAQRDIEADANRLARMLNMLLDDTEKRVSLGQKLHSYAKPDASAKLAQLLLHTADEAA